MSDISVILMVAAMQLCIVLFSIGVIFILKRSQKNRQKSESPSSLNLIYLICVYLFTGIAVVFAIFFTISLLNFVVYNLM